MIGNIRIRNEKLAVTAVISITLLVTLTTITASVAFTYMANTGSLLESNTVGSVSFVADDNGICAISGSEETDWGDVEVIVSGEACEVPITVDPSLGGLEGSIVPGDSIDIVAAVTQLPENTNDVNVMVIDTKNNCVINKITIDISAFPENEEAEEEPIVVIAGSEDKKGVGSGSGLGGGLSN